MPPTMPPLHDLDKDEVDARVSVLHHRKTQERFHRAQAALDQAADSGFADICALDLIDEYEDAKAEMEDCEKNLGKIGHIPKDERGDLEQEVQDKHERLPGLKYQAQMTDADFRNWQQDQERSRIERESQLAAASRTAAAPLPQMPVPEPHRPGTGADRTADPQAGGAAVLHGPATHDAGRKPSSGKSRRGGPVTTSEFEEAGKDDIGSRQVPARPGGPGTASRPGAPQNPAAGAAANRVADPSLAKGNEPAADARKADTDKDLEPNQPRENSPQAEEERRTGVAKQ